MRGARHVEASGQEIDRPQFDMRFQEKAVRVDRHLEAGRKLGRRGRGYQRRGEHQIIGRQRHLLAEDFLEHAHHGPAVLA